MIDRLKLGVRSGILPVGRALASIGLTPNSVTIIGCLLNFGVGALLALGYLQLGGALIIVVGLFDILDGAIARAANQATIFGAYLDSTLDRYSEAAVFFGILVYGTLHADLTIVALTYAATVGSLMVSYARARAEGLGFRGDVGWLQRPERLILLALGLLLGLLVPALWVLAIFSNVTAIQRILHVRHLASQK